MKKRICSIITSFVISAILILGILMTVIFFYFNKQQAINEITNMAEISKNISTDGDNLYNVLKNDVNYDVRLTIINLDGTVMYDSSTDSTKLDNHSDRPEVKDAISLGKGEDERFSKSLATKTYYYAIKVDDKIFRFSREIDSIFSVFLTVIPLLLVACGFVIIIATYISFKLSDSLIAPVTSLVEQIDIFDDEKTKTVNTPYEEFIPIAKTVNSLKKQINEYITQLVNEKKTISVITENMAEGMILLSENLNILSVNKSAITFLNPEFRFSQTKNLIQLTRNNEIISLIENAEKSDKTVTKKILIQGDKAIYLRVSVNHIVVSQLNGYLVLLVDITDSVKAEEIRRDFSANVSHELKTPLTTIKGFGEMISCGMVNNKEDVQKYGTTIHRESERLLSLINDIIRLSEIEDGQQRAEFEKLNLCEIAVDVINLLSMKAEKKNIDIKLSSNNVYLNGNYNYISELFFNLIDNGIKYNNENGYVKVEVYEKGKDAIIKISDNGIGIPKEHQARIFERFYRVDKSRSKQSGGTGLGLSIVKHIVMFHSGEISLESEAGKGTTITISLPKNK